MSSKVASDVVEAIVDETMEAAGEAAAEVVEDMVTETIAETLGGGDTAVEASDAGAIPRAVTAVRNDGFPMERWNDGEDGGDLDFD